MPNNSRVVAILPARWASTRFPGKPLHSIAGKPLIQRVWERTRLARGIDRVIIATDDERIAQAAADFGAEAALTSSAHQSGTDRIAEVARRLSEEGDLGDQGKKRETISHIINVQGDEPLICPELLDRVADTLRSDPSLSMLTAAHPFAPGEDVGNPNAVKVVLDCHDDALYFSRSPIPYQRDTAPGQPAPVYLRHLGLYGYTLPFLLQYVQWPPSSLEMAEQLEQLRALENGAKIRVLLTGSGSVGVDTPADALHVEKLLTGEHA